jgi:S-adenosylmethionine:tRNA ribosyltransferase-isomerase
LAKLINFAPYKLTMENIQSISIEDYNYKLEDEKIAKYPINERDGSRLLVYQNKVISERTFRQIPELLDEKSLVIFNNTKVIQARLIFFKETGARIEFFCLEPYDPSDYALSFQQKGSCSWRCLVGNQKRWKQTEVHQIISTDNHYFTLTATPVKDEKSNQVIRFSWDDYSLCFSDILEILGKTPIPPYLKRESEDSDKIRYQTVYSKLEGSVAAPTAGLHFTDQVLKELKMKGIHVEEITLHVGAGTFKPVKSSLINEHEMHTEHFYIKKETIMLIKQQLKQVVAIGTTTLRTLESCYWIGLNLIRKEKDPTFISQWKPYENIQDVDLNDSLQAIIDYLDCNSLDMLEGSTQIMIVPGYKFKVTDVLVTNFHQPRSTLLLLVAAFIGKDWKTVYNYALKNDFRFLSYGDSSVLFR